MFFVLVGSHQSVSVQQVEVSLNFSSLLLIELQIFAAGVAFVLRCEIDGVDAVDSDQA